MRRIDRALDKKYALELLHEGEFGVLSTIGEDLQPYGVPLNYWLQGEDIYFHCAVEGRKIEHFLYTPNVSFCVVCKSVVLPEKFTTDFKSVMVSGQVMEVLASDKRVALVEMLRRFSPDHLEKGEKYIKAMLEKTRVFRIASGQITGKANC